MCRAPWVLAAAALAAGPIAAGPALAMGHDARRAEAASPLFARDKDHVGASTCRGCHLDHYASWRRTYHASMTQRPDRATVRGRFDGAPRCRRCCNGPRPPPARACRRRPPVCSSRPTGSSIVRAYDRCWACSAVT